MARLLLVLLAFLALGLASTLPGYSWSLVPSDKVVYKTSLIYLLKSNGGLPVYLGSYNVLPASSGACVYGWWRDVLGVDKANSANINGNGVKILIIDSGVDDKVLQQAVGRKIDYHFNASYEVYKNMCTKNVTYGNISYCVLDEYQLDWRKVVYAIPLNSSLDELGHGTAVAATILSIAPNATIYSARVTIDVLLVDDNNRVYAKEVLLDDFAINWALTHAVYGPDGKEGTNDDVDIVNMSLGGVYYPLPGPLYLLDAPLQAYIWNLYREPMQKLKDRVLFVVAAGNEAENIPSWPAAFDESTAVAALQYVNDTWSLAPFSSRGMGIDFAELGSGMYLPVPTYSIIAQEVNDGCSNTSGLVKWVRLDGTSFAAPILSGIAALWEQYTGYKGEKLFDALKSASVDLGPPGYDQETGWGMPLAPMNTSDSDISSTSSYGLPIVFPLPFLLKRRKKMLLLLLGIIGLTYALNVTALSLSATFGLATGLTAYMLYSSSLYDPLALLVSLGVASLEAAFIFLSILIIRYVLKLLKG